MLCVRQRSIVNYDKTHQSCIPGRDTPGEYGAWPNTPKGSFRRKVYMEGEVKSLDEEIRAFRAGEVETAKFMPFRLRQGVYGQRRIHLNLTLRWFE